MEDIAKELNISIVSVSNALRNKKGVSTELRQRVKETADALGYQIPQVLEEEEERICCIGIMIAERYIEEPSSFYMNIYK
ncbi:helix-turn-helix domain-containing protein, partial [Romboutsia ilealis]|uniref:helix-turn-helix domain-containing protein n=1 Tax=Romboutsia ilealis TaxID=1115758 RepID=UPI00272D5137